VIFNTSRKANKSARALKFAQESALIRIEQHPAAVAPDEMCYIVGRKSRRSPT
jgi:hypothetical protein